MSSRYIVRQPIKTADGKILAYEILYHGGNQAFGDDSAAGEFAATDTVYKFLMQNSEKTFKGTTSFMTFTTMLLMKKTPNLFDPSELVIQIDDSVIIHPVSMHFVNRYAKEGYKIAINEFQFSPRYLSLLDSIDYIKINAATTSEGIMRNIIEIAHSINKTCIICNIETEEQYQRALAMEADGFSGPYVAQNSVSTVSHSSAYLQSNFFRLMVAVTRDEPNVDEIEQLIAMDASLSFGLLKMANSAYFALRHRATTIHQAIMTLGLSQLKQWIYLLSASNSEEEPTSAATEDFLKRSFMRANFCKELMTHAKGLPISKSEAYLMGMFSTLDHLIDAPLADILNEIPVVEEIKTALLTRKGPCGKLYELVLSYEAADWDRITVLAEELSIPKHMLTNIYFVCVDNTNTLWEQLTNLSPNQS